MDIKKLSNLVGSVQWEDLKEYMLEEVDKSTEIDTMNLNKSNVELATDIKANQKCRKLVRILFQNIEIGCKELIRKDKSYR